MYESKIINQMKKQFINVMRSIFLCLVFVSFIQCSEENSIIDDSIVDNIDKSKTKATNYQDCANPNCSCSDCNNGWCNRDECIFWQDYENANKRQKFSKDALVKCIHFMLLRLEVEDVTIEDIEWIFEYRLHVNSLGDDLSDPREIDKAIKYFFTWDENYVHSQEEMMDLIGHEHACLLTVAEYSYDLVVIHSFCWNPHFDWLDSWAFYNPVTGVEYQIDNSGTCWQQVRAIMGVKDFNRNKY